MATTKSKTRKTRTPKPIPALLPGGFQTALENRIAELNNVLAAEGRLTTDPAYVHLREIRRELVKQDVVTFERVVRGQGQGAAATAQPAPQGSTQGKKRRKRRKKSADSDTSTAKATDAPKIRKIDEEDVMKVQVPGSVDEKSGAVYGTDKSGAFLAPYGVKKSGFPAKRRGLGAPPWEREEETESADVAAEAEEPKRVMTEPAKSKKVEASSEDDEDELDLDLSGDDEDESDDEDLDELLEGLTA